MEIPFLSYFKRAPKAPAAPLPVTPVEKKAYERLSKTVRPNNTRTVLPSEQFEGVPPARSLRQTDALMKSELPPAVAIALEPKVERVISLELRDIVAQMPEGWTRPVTNIEGKRRVLLKAAEIEKGMSSGKPSACLPSVYKQIPEIFVRPVTPSDETQVPLPFQKVLDQFSKLQTRSDQFQDQTVPQVETPFLQLTVEDSERMGVKMAPVETSPAPTPAGMQPATAQSLAAAEPESFIKVKAKTGPTVPEISVSRAPDGSRPVIKLPVEELPPERPIPTEFEPASAAKAEPTRIPFNLSPIGTGEPASERVPASSGPSVPTSSAAPTRIEFKLPTDDDGSVAAAAPAVEKKPEHQISLALKPILLALPPFQLTGDANSVGDDVRINVPFSLVESQLSTGRISLQASEFEGILPEQYRSFFSSKEISAPVVLPLQDVLKNLPDQSLRMREDQEEQDKGEDFKTPFSAKAAEDAKRFGAVPKPKAEPKAISKEPTPKPTISAAVEAAYVEEPGGKEEEPAEVEGLEPVDEAESLENPSQNGTRSALQTALDTDEDIDAKTVVAHVGKLAGVKGCAIMFNDGLGLAGNLPGEFQAEGLCALGPSFLMRLEDHIAATQLGALRAVTLSCAKAAITFFMHDDLCLAALHAKDELAADVRERLARAVHELSKTYSNPA